MPILARPGFGPAHCWPGPARPAPPDCHLKLQAIPEEEEEVERNQRSNTMEDFWRPIIQEEYSVVRQPAIEANNF